METGLYKEEEPPEGVFRIKREQTGGVKKIVGAFTPEALTLMTRPSMFPRSGGGRGGPVNRRQKKQLKM